LRNALAQIVSRHDWYDLDCCIEIRKERFGNLDNLRRLGEIKKHHSAAHPIRWPEVSGLRFEFIHYRLQRFSERTVLEGLVSLFYRKSKLKHHAHWRLPSLMKKNSPNCRKSLAAPRTLCNLILQSYIEYVGRQLWPPQRLVLCQPFQIHEGFDHTFAIDQRVQQNRQNGRAGRPAHPSEQQAEHEDLADGVPVVLHMDE